MVVKIDLSYIPDNIRCIILDVVDRLVPSKKESSHKTIVLYDEWNAEEIKHILEEELRLKNFTEYVISENTHDESEIAVLKKGDIEQLGIYVCMHCGMPFESQAQRTVHERIHYF
jgi:rubrerythrin